MPYDGNGNYVRTHNWTADAANALDISATEMDQEDNSLAAALSNAVTRDGQGKMTVDFLPNADNTLNLGNGSFRWATLNGVPVSQLTPTRVGISTLIYPLIQAEITAGVTTPSYIYPPGNINRYGTNTTPGTTDMTAAFNTAIAVAKAGLGFVYLPAALGPYNFLSTIIANAVNGILIYGDAAAIFTQGTHYANNTVLLFDGNGSGNDGLVISNSIGVVVKNLMISHRHGGAGGGKALRFHTGHDFLFENIKVDSLVGNTGAGISLGNATGATSAFVGRLVNCKVMMSSGGNAFESNNANTSITFISCYSINGTFAITGTVYSSLISCASDGSTTYGYTVLGGPGNPSQGIAFIGCGAESNALGGWRINGCANITLVAPVGVSNNVSATANIGSLVYLDSTVGGNNNITIINPVDSNPNAASTNSIYGTASTGTTKIENANSTYLVKGVGGDTTWMQNSLTIEGESALEVQTFTAAIGVNWTNTGAPVVTATFIKKGKLITFSTVVTPATNIKANAGATITLPWTQLGSGGSCTQVDGNGASYGACAVAAGKIFVQTTGVLTVPLIFQGSFFIA